MVGERFLLLYRTEATVVVGRLRELSIGLRTIVNGVELSERTIEHVFATSCFPPRVFHVFAITCVPRVFHHVQFRAL